MRLKKDPKHNEWASFVRNHTDGSPFQHPDCFAIFNTYSKIPPKVFRHYDNEDNINGVILALPCSFFPTIPSVPKAYISFNGPIADSRAELERQHDIQSVLINRLKKEKGLLRPYLEIRDFYNIIKRENPPERERGTPYLNLVKDITTPEQLMDGVSNMRLRHINKIDNGFVTADPATIYELESFLKILQSLYKHIRKPILSSRVIEGIFATREEQDSFRVVVTKHSGRVCGGAILGFCGTTCYEWYIASDRTVKECGTAATFGAMRYAMERGCSSFNFMGIGRAGVPYGVRDFKCSFGGEMVEYMRYRL